MFVVKIYNSKQIFDVKHYNVFQNALADVADKNIFDNIPDDVFATLENPEIYYGSCSSDGVADDFEFRYPNGINVYIGEILVADAVKVSTASCNEIVTEMEIETVVKALAGHYTLTTTHLSEKIEGILRKHTA